MPQFSGMAESAGQQGTDRSVRWCFTVAYRSRASSIEQTGRRQQREAISYFRTIELAVASDWGITVGEKLYCNVDHERCTLSSPRGDLQ